MKKLFIASIVLVSCLNAWSYENLKTYGEGLFQFDTAASYFKTDSNYRNGGNKDSLPGGFSYNLIDVNLSGRYLISHSLAFYGGASVGTSQSKDSLKTLTNSSLSGIKLGSDYLLLDDGFRLALDVSLLIPIEKVSDTMDTSLNSDGAMHVTPRLIASSDIGAFTPYGYVGANWRDQGLSTLALYGGGIRMTFSDLSFGAEVNGYSTVINDKYTDQSSKRENILNLYNAGSKSFYSINPSGIDTDLYAQYNVTENWMLHMSGGMTLTGSESAAGYHVAGMVRFSLPTQGYARPVQRRSVIQQSPQRRQTSPPARVQPPPKPSKQFEDEIENENGDENYFKPIETNDENSYVEPLDSQAEQLQKNNYESSDSGNPDYKINLKKKKKSGR